MEMTRTQNKVEIFVLKLFHNMPICNAMLYRKYTVKNSLHTSLNVNVY